MATVNQAIEKARSATYPSRDLLNRRTFCLSALGAAGLAIGGGGCREKQTGPPNVILIVLDTVRADHLGCWGYKRRTSPRIDTWARVSTAYRHAYATAPWTLPSHATIFTGRHTFQHGLDASLRTGANGEIEVVEPPVPDSEIMLAETLREAGYVTAAFTANTAYMSMRWNFMQGFNVYEVQRRPGIEMLEPVSTWLRARKNGPFFLFVNFMDAHFRYNTKPCPGAFDEPVSQDTGLINKLLESVLPGDKPADEQLVREVTAQYDMGIANADYAMGQMLDDFEKQGVYDNSLIIVTSDHGEFLGEHLLAQHSKDLYEEVLHVPLLVKAPGQRQGRWSDKPVSLIQLYGTMLDAAGIGQASQAPDLETDAPLLAELRYSRPWDVKSPVWGKRFNRIRTAYYEFPWKIIHSSDGRHEMYHLQEDPAEANNRVDESPDRARDMLARLAAIKPLSAVPVPSAGHRIPELTEQDKEALRSNGYL